MSSRTVLSVYADDTRVNSQDFPGNTTIRQLKGQVKDGLKKKLGLTNDSFHPSSKDHNDIQLSVPRDSSKKITDDDTVAGLCPTSGDYILAVVPSAPALGSPGNNFPEISLLFPIQPYPTFTPAHATPSPAPQANDYTNVLITLQALALKLETAELNLMTADLQRKKDMENAESLRKEDAERAEALRKKDAERAEALRKKDAERAEALRKKDAEKAESLRKEDAERAEALRKKDAENAESLRRKVEKAELLRKKDAERMEALRQKDRAELEDKIKHLEQHSSE